MEQFDEINDPQKNQEIPEIPEVKSPRTFHQLGILLLDGSGSMSTLGDGQISLADHVNRAVRDFLGYFKNSSVAENISIAVITFDHTANIHTDITELNKIDDFADYNPLNGHGGGTYIGGALVKAAELAERFLNNPEAASIPYDVRIIVMSDGLCQEPEQTKQIADQLKQNNKIMLCSSLFTPISKVGETDFTEAKTVLSDIATAINLYKTTYKETDLRQFFITSMSAKRKFSNEKY
jgi:uncharacterized protein YegL